MTLDLSLLRWSLLPGFIQTGNDDPRKAHFLGRKSPTPLEGNQETGRKNEEPPKKSSHGKYFPLADLTLREVEHAKEMFLPQLVPSPTPGWIARNYFCSLPLKRNLDERPSVVFGRVQTCYPMGGQLGNIGELEMHFPRENTPPDLLHIYQDDIHPRQPIESYCIGIQAHLSEAEMQDFSHSENIFIEKGFAPLYNAGYADLLDIGDGTHSSLPWVYLFGSEWFATVPDSMQPEVKEKLRLLVHRGQVVLNYHPKRYTLRYRSLNDELDYQYGFTENYLLMPQDTGQVLNKVEEKFGEKFLFG